MGGSILLLLVTVVSCFRGSSANLKAWVPLSKHNFSSDVLEHPFVFCIATVPWCGESRSIMKELLESVQADNDLHTLVELRVIHVNVEKSLSFMLYGERKIPVFTLYREAVPYKYTGKIRIQSLLNGIRHVLSLPSSNLPFERLESLSQVKVFMEYTDKTVILFDFCKWTDSLVRESKCNAFPDQVLCTSEHGSSANNSCDVSACDEQVESKDLSQRWLGWVGHSMGPMYDHEMGICLPEDNVGVMGHDQHCNTTEYERFSTLYWNLTDLAEAHVLTPEKMKFGIITNKSLLLDLGIAYMDKFSWFLMKQESCRPSAPTFHFEGSGLETFISSLEQLVPELHPDLPSHRTVFSNDTPSIILFVDRASLSLEIQTKSWAALKLFQTVAAEYIRPRQYERHDSFKKQMSSEAISLKDKDWRVIKITRLDDLQGLVKYSGVDDVLAAFAPVVQKNSHESSNKEYSVRLGTDEKKVSLVLHEVSLQVEDMIQLEAQISNAVSQGSAIIGSRNAITEMYEDISETESAQIDESDPVMALYEKMPVKGGTVSDATFESPEDATSGGGRIASRGHEDDDGDASKHHAFEGVTTVKSTDDVSHLDDGSSTKSEEPAYTIAFFFADGEDRLNSIIFSCLTYPAIVILDPIQNGQFVYPVNQSINYSSLKAFINSYAGGVLKPNYTSESKTQSPRERVRPPFVNRDFHEVNGVLRVSMDTLSPWLFERSSSKNILLLLTVPWCGFCKRMELVFREVHQLMTDHLATGAGVIYKADILKELESDGNRPYWEMGDVEGHSKSAWITSAAKDLPLLAQIDCTANDCSGIFQGVQQSYPSVLLFPRTRRELPIIYGGGSTVYEIIEFLVHEDILNSKITQAFQEKIWKRKMPTTSKYGSGCSSLKYSQDIQSSPPMRHKFQFDAQTSTKASSSEDLASETYTSPDESLRPSIQPMIGSMLVATELLSRRTVFEDTIILIVKVDVQESFHGLIVNKPLPWKVAVSFNRRLLPYVNRTALFYGGPVVVHGHPFLSLTRLKDVEGFTEVTPGVKFGGPITTTQVLQLIEDEKLHAEDFWFFLGHAVWGWQQLFDELGQQVWELMKYMEGIADFPVKEWLEGVEV